MKQLLTPSNKSYLADSLGYTLRGHGFGIYSEFIFVEIKAMKRAHSWLRNCFINAAIGKNKPLEIRNCGRVKYMTTNITTLLLFRHYKYYFSLIIAPEEKTYPNQLWLILSRSVYHDYTALFVQFFPYLLIKHSFQPGLISVWL